ncbi:hypothetical protein NVV94_10810 [Pseudomonas sp. LS1212]|uniref:hypothetical protein n=1 Tax=Pseudomonas sp. LS1212 TaxID=2972478 RepID=UPI00215C633A|nr:hypothetical protein [Pseudomonas sp. LS1212]UVJ45985.1 hypothetical protein NVV94_10810 [Pseudomonas sp. LS1212]
MDSIRNPHELILEALEIRDALAAAAHVVGTAELIAKLEDLLSLASWHGGQQLKAQNLIAQARLLLK